MLLLVTSPLAVGVPFRTGFLLLAGTTGPVTGFLAPFYLWRAIRERTRLAWVEAGLVGLCAAGQAWLTVRSIVTAARPGAFDPQALLAAAGIKQLAYPFLGEWAFDAAQTVLAGSWTGQAMVTGIILLLCIAVALVLFGHPVARLLGLAAAGVGALSMAGALGADPWVSVSPLIGGRYAYAPNAMMGLGLVVIVLASGMARWRRTVAAVLLAAFLVNGILAWHSKFRVQGGPDWHGVVAAWRADPARQDLAIWPHGWVMTLPRSIAGR